MISDLADRLRRGRISGETLVTREDAYVLMDALEALRGCVKAHGVGSDCASGHADPEECPWCRARLLLARVGA